MFGICAGVPLQAAMSGNSVDSASWSSSWTLQEIRRLVVCRRC